MSAFRVSVLQVFLLAAILSHIDILNAHSQSSQALQNIDTSGYIPSFYNGALEYNLMVAASEGYAYEVERFIARGADIDAETAEGVTPLIFAVKNNRLAAVRTLLYYGAEVNNHTTSYETPLLIAVKNRNFEITEALIRAGAGINNPDRHGATPLHHASLYGYLDIADLLLYYDASVDLKSEEGTTPLLAAIWAGYPDVADLLIQNGANMETRDNDTYTPFLMAALYGDTLIMDMLFEKGVDIYATTKTGHNALTLSIMGNHIEATKYLLRIGDKWPDTAEYTLSPYNVASKYQRKEMIDLLEKNSIPGHLKYEIDQVSITASSRIYLNDLYTGINLSFKEPYLNGGFIAGIDTKLWYSRVLLQNSENLYYQYMDKGSIAYAGLFKDFALTDRPGRYNISLSTCLMAGYSFGNKLKGTNIPPENKFMIIPSVSFKLTKLHLSFIGGVEYIKTGYYHNGPIWLRIGLSYNHFFDNVRTQIKTLNWY